MNGEYNRTYTSNFVVLDLLAGRREAFSPPSSGLLILDRVPLLHKFAFPDGEPTSRVNGRDITPILVPAKWLARDPISRPSKHSLLLGSAPSLHQLILMEEDMTPQARLLRNELSWRGVAGAAAPASLQGNGWQPPFPYAPISAPSSATRWRCCYACASMSGRNLTTSHIAGNMYV
jgi:hypothetical protein